MSLPTKNGEKARPGRFGRVDLFIAILLFFVALIPRVINLDWGLPGQNYPHSQFNYDETAELYASLLLFKRLYQVQLIRYQPFFYFASIPFFSSISFMDW